MKLLIGLIFTICAIAQDPLKYIQADQPVGQPCGAGGSPLVQVNTLNGKVFICANNAWQLGSSGGSSPTGPAGGSLSGNYPNPAIAASGVSTGTYGSATSSAQIIVLGDGRVSSASNVNITPSFSSLIGGTATVSMWMGTAGTLSTSGTGIIDANELNGTKLSTLSTGLVKVTTSSGAISTGGLSDITTLWSGSCSSTTFLRGDGACAAVSLTTSVTGTLQAGQAPTFSGDITNSAFALTLNTVNSGSGACGDSTHVCQITTNGKGLVTTQAAVSISGGGGGTSNQALLDCGVTRTSATVLTIFPSASSTDFCEFATNSGTYNVTGAETITLSSGTPTVRTYLSDGSDGNSAGARIVCSSTSSGVAVSGGLTLVTSCSAFPVSGGIYQHSSWTATVGGTWDSTGTLIRPLMNGGMRMIAGAFLTVAPTTSGTTFALDTTKLTRPAGTYIVSGNDALGAAAGTLICTDGSSGVTTSGCSGGGGGGTYGTTFTMNIPLGGCYTGSAFPAWDMQNSTANQLAVAYCNNSTDVYSGMQIAFAALTQQSSFSVVIPAGWTSGAVALSFYAMQNDSGSGNAIFQAQTFCQKATTNYQSSGWTYNTLQATNTVTNPTVNLLTKYSIASLTMTGCAAGNTLTVLVKRNASDTYSGSLNLITANVQFN